MNIENTVSQIKKLLFPDSRSKNQNNSDPNIIANELKIYNIGRLSIWYCSTKMAIRSVDAMIKIICTIVFIKKENSTLGHSWWVMLKILLKKCDIFCSIKVFNSLNYSTNLE